LRIRLLDHNHALVLNRFGLDLLLLCGFQIAFFLRLFSHALHSLHHIGLLGQEGVAEIGGPLNVIGEALDHFREPGQSLHAWIPWLLRHSVGQFLFPILEVLVLREPLLELDDLKRIRRRRQHLSEKRIGIKGNRSDQRVELVGRNLRWLLRRLSFFVGLLYLLRLFRNLIVAGRLRLA
jgi:hypothetical protein